MVKWMEDKIGTSGTSQNNIQKSEQFTSNTMTFNTQYIQEMSIHSRNKECIYLSKE